MIGNVLIKTTSATAIDCSHIENITGIAITSAEPADTKTRYCLELYVFADSSKVKSGVEFCFDGTRWDYNWRHEFALGNYKVFNHLQI